MLNVDLIRCEPEKVKDGIAKKNVNTSLVDDFLDLDKGWRDLVKEVDDLRAELNKLSKDRKIDEAKKVKEKLKSKEQQLPEIEKERGLVLQKLPNLPAEDWP